MINKIRKINIFFVKETYLETNDIKRIHFSLKIRTAKHRKSRSAVTCQIIVKVMNSFASEFHDSRKNILRTLCIRLF